LGKKSSLTSQSETKRELSAVPLLFIQATVCTLLIPFILPLKIFCIKKRLSQTRQTKNLLYHSILYDALQYGFNKIDIHPL